MCDPSPEKVVVREAAVPFVTYERHCEALRNPPPGFDVTVEHMKFIASLFEMQPAFPIDYYEYTAFSPYETKSYKLGGMDHYPHQHKTYYPPGNRASDCWVILTIAHSVMVRPWGLGKYESYDTVGLRSAIGLNYQPTEVIEKYNLIDRFPFKEAHFVELTPDNTYYGGAPRVSVQKRSKVLAYLLDRQVRFSANWDNNMFFNFEMFERHPINAPFFAGVIVDDASVIEDLKAI